MNVQLFNVAPQMPKELAFLEELAGNIWWCWHPLAIELFVRINPNLWHEVEGNAKAFLSRVSQSRFEELAKDSTYLRQIKAVKAEFEHQVPAQDDISKRRVAYFSMEYGIHESVRLYSGGLGILSGDHLKAASDMSLEMVGVGLLYRQGYFRQILDRNGWQMERYPDNELHNMPIQRAKDANDREVTISIKLINRELFAAVWVMRVGNVPLILLDTEIPQNPPEFREISWRLYGGDKKMRLHQELLLGIGGFKALIALGYEPSVCHMNEGHAAFLSLARIEYLIGQGYEPNVALEMVWRSNIFTTHTPVPAGNEVFAIDLIRPYLAAYASQIGIDVNRIIRWGIPINEREHASEMSMTVLGLRLANYSNAVAKLHGVVARHMWKELWPGRSVDEIPITHITNGVHVPSWTSNRLKTIFNHYLSPDWAMNPSIDALRAEVNAIPDEDIWMAHEMSRQSLIRYARTVVQKKFNFDNAAGKEIYSKGILNPDALTIGFARRFATYKRATLLLRNPERLVALLKDKTHPVQFVFAGKAHPADNGGKSLIQQLIQFAQREHVRDRLIFLEDYDISIARRLVQGVDVWLNTPRRPMEASGTSGMKAAINGVLNCSILDGWWDEAYEPGNGWAIQGNPSYTDPEDTDNFESQSLFNILENEIIPCFYERVGGDIPTRWVEKMKESIVMGLAKFSSYRMVQDYARMFYRPAVEAYDKLSEKKAAKAKKLVDQKMRLEGNFPKLWVDNPKIDRDLSRIHVGDSFVVTTRVYLAELAPEDVKVEAYFGQVDNHNEIVSSSFNEMKLKEKLPDGTYRYEGTVQCNCSGRFGVTTRINAAGSDWDNSVPGFACWPK